MTFTNFGFCKEILKAINEQGYKAPTEIQSRVIPLILQKKDILGRAQTGTGKTASFMLPLLQLLTSKPSKKKTYKPKVLVLAPTRELAMQVYDNAQIYGKHLPLRSMVVYGGVPIWQQIRKLRRGVDILVATPGRLLDHVNQKTIDLSSVRYFVLDEADCMLDMGFIHDIQKIISYLPEQKQTLLFSATFTKGIEKLAEDLLHSPEIVQVAEKNAVSEQVKQTMYPVDRARKSELLVHLISSQNLQQALVFTRTKHSADRLLEKLSKEKIASDVIHGDKSQAARSRALKRFKLGKTRILVATDVAARGLDIQNLPFVFNYELPFVKSDYIHRIGRTGRAGNTGEAISLVSRDEVRLLNEIEKLLKKPLEKSTVKGFEIELTGRGSRQNDRRKKAPFYEKFKNNKRGSFSRTRKPGFKKARRP